MQCACAAAFVLLLRRLRLSRADFSYVVGGLVDHNKVRVLVSQLLYHPAAAPHLAPNFISSSSKLLPTAFEFIKQSRA
jgi:hypothetical protein